MQILRDCLLLGLMALMTHSPTAQIEQNEQGKTQNNPILETYRQTVSEKLGTFEIFRKSVRRDDPAYNRRSLNLTIPADMAAQWTLELHRNDLIAADYRAKIQTAQRSVQERSEPPLVMNGWLNGNPAHRVGMTIDDDFLYGGVYDGEELYMIEPLRFFIAGAPGDLYIIYASSTVKNQAEGKCGFEEYRDQLDRRHKNHQNNYPEGDRSSVGNCYKLELAIASDYSMYDKYNDSESDVINHNIGVINNVQTNYTGEFDDDIEFVIVEQFVSTCSSCDPWTSSTSANVLLSDFRDWGNSSGFSTSFDLGELWTDRDLNGSTIGIAFIAGLCNFNKYHVLQDFTVNGDLLRVLTAHEIGHNLNGIHDGAPNFIMSSTVSNTNTWSSQSLADISNYIDNNANVPACLENCVALPDADFSANVTDICEGEQVEFTDESSGTVTSWSWTFDGGNPSSSNMQNPTVTYNTAGTYDVTLEVGNSSGSDTETKTAYINVTALPEASFEYEVFGQTVDFTNTSQNGTSYNWMFGDGQTSTDEHPEHFYSEPGTYTVQLTTVNQCGSEAATQTIEIIVTPEAAFSADTLEGCEGLTVQFTDESENLPTSWLWSFPGGTPSSSIEQNPTVTYNTAGTYDVELVATNSAGSDALSKSEYVTIIPDPVAGFTYSVNGMAVDFTNTSQADSSYSWDFGDGNTSSDENPAHTYDEDGTYEVELSVSNECGGDVITHLVSISSLPIADFNADMTENCPPFTVQFEDESSVNTTSWDWSFPGGTPSSSTEQNPEVTYEEAGNFDVTLITSNAEGSDTMNKEQFISVLEPTSASFDFAIDNYMVTFINMSSGANSYQWNFGDGASSNQMSPTHTFDGDGVYEVQLIATGECGPDTTVESVELLYPPEAGFNADVNEGCEPLTVEFAENASENSEVYNWSFPGGTPSSSSEPNPVVTYHEPGSYNVSLIVSNSQGSDQLVRQDFIVVLPQPEAGFTFSRDEFSVDFTDQSSDANSWSWNFGDGETSSSQNPDHTYDNQGNYTVSLIVGNSCGMDTFEQMIEVNELPTAGFTGDTIDGCSPFSVQFTDQSSSSVTSWAWMFPGGNPSMSTDSNPVVTYEEAGTYDVTLTVTNQAGSDTIIKEEYIQVISPPTADFSFEKTERTVEFESNSDNADSLIWKFGDGSMDTVKNPEHEYEENGTYTVLLIAENNCGRDTSIREIQIDVSSTTTLDDDSSIFSVFPNPVRQTLFINCSDCAANPVQWRVYSAEGRQLRSGSWDRLHESAGEKSVEVSDYSPGLYYLELRTEDHYKYFKFIVAK